MIAIKSVCGIDWFIVVMENQEMNDTDYLGKIDGQEQIKEISDSIVPSCSYVSRHSEETYLVDAWTPYEFRQKKLVTLSGEIDSLETGVKDKYQMGESTQEKTYVKG